MVTVYFGQDKRGVLDPDTYFFGAFYPEWFEDENVKQMVRDIDQSEVQAPYCIMSPVLGQISPHMISGGVKGLMLLMKDPEFYPDTIIFGENCEPWLSYIFEHYDVHVCCSGFDLVFRDLPIHGICENDGSQINNYEDWCNKMQEFVLTSER